MPKIEREKLDLVDAVTEITAISKTPGQMIWTVVGKGPSVEQYIQEDFKCSVITLNHACKHIKPTIAHFVDWDAYESCRDSLAPGSLVAMPWHPHIRNKATEATIANLATVKDHANKWLVYDASTAMKLPKWGKRRFVTLRYFSATAVFDLLVQAKNQTIFSVGVDGGDKYAKQFSTDTLLSNGRKSFDIQTEVIRRICGATTVWVQLPAVPRRLTNGSDQDIHRHGAEGGSGEVRPRIQPKKIFHRPA